MKIAYLIIFGLIFLMWYVSVLTGFFATYYYDSKINRKIKIIDTNEGYFSHILFIAGIFFINTIITLFYNIIIGIIGYCILILLGISIMFLIKRNMKNITEINCVSIRYPATVKFKSGLLTILLSPFSNIIFIIIFLIILSSFIIIEKIIE
jgi:hypothetical protein